MRSKKLDGMDRDTPTSIIRERDASRYISMSVAWLRQGRARGRGPSFLRINRAIRYRLQDLDEWLLSQRVESRETGK